MLTSGFSGTSRHDFERPVRITRYYAAQAQQPADAESVVVQSAADFPSIPWLSTYVVGETAAWEISLPFLFAIQGDGAKWCIGVISLETL